MTAKKKVSAHRFQKLFGEAAAFVARMAGKPSAFLAALMTVVVWGAVGPVFNYSDTWQLVINTGTTIVTFLMVFLIQNSQNRDNAAIQIKLDELSAPGRWKTLSSGLNISLTMKLKSCGKSARSELKQNGAPN